MIKSAEITDKLVMYFIEHGMQIVTGIVIIVAGLFCTRWVGNVVQRWLEKHKLEPQVRQLITKLLRLIVFAGFVVMALGQMGIQITPLLAGIGVAGVGLSLATQSVLGNLVAGLNIIFSKPFRVGDYIEIVGVQGQVEQISLFSTTLVHPDQSRVVVPNRKIVGEILHNYQKIRQVEVNIGIGYDANVPQALAVIREVVVADPRVLRDPPPIVAVAALGDSAVQIAVRPWVSIDDYGAAGGDIYQALLATFRTRGMSVPRLQREVHLIGRE